MLYRLCYSSVLCASLFSLASVLALGDISGTVTLVGKPASQDTTVYSGTVTGCGGNGYHKSEHWKVGPKGELGDVVVWVVDPKLVAPVTPDPDHPVPNPKMDQAQCTYLPYVIATTPSRAVEFVNSDPVLHNVLARTSAGANQLDGGDVVFNLPEIEGQHSTESFDTPGLYTLQCSSHSWMQAWVYVLPESCAGFFAVSDKLGTFTFGAAPYTLADGDYVVKAWHSRFYDLVEGKLHCAHGTGTIQLVFPGDKSF